MTDDPDALAAKFATPALIFLGAHTPEAIGDYVGGSNHVLPTARFGAILLRARVTRFHEAHLDPEMARTSCVRWGPLR